MKSLIWKELRENLKWVPLPGLVILLVFFIDKPEEAMPDYTASFFFALIAVAFGAALGFVQVFFEAQGDKRSILMHRPLSPSGIFLSKALVGVGLYLLATGIPFLTLEIWYSIPGKMAAPYHWRMSLPWVADILSGLVYYFAGILVAQRDARWLGSRVLPLAAGFFCSYLVWVVPEFWQATLAIAVLGTFMSVAAWGSFCTGGFYGPLPRLAKTSLAFVFIGGLLIVSILGKQRLGEWLDEGIDYEYTMDRDGRVFFQRFKPGIGVIGPVTDLNGQEVPDHRDSPAASAPLVWTETPVFCGYRNTGRFYVKCANDSTQSQELWFYDQIEHRLLGYDTILHQSLGSFSPSGFAEPEQDALGHTSPFPEGFKYRCNPRRGLEVEFLTFAYSIYYVNFARRTIHAFFTPPPGESVVFISRWKDHLDQERTGLVVSTEHSFHFLRKDGRPVVSVPRLLDSQKYRTVLAGPLGNGTPPDRYLIWYQSMMPWTTALEPEQYRNLPGYLHEYDVAGQEQSQREIPAPPYAETAYAQAFFGLVMPMTEVATLVETSTQLRARERSNGSIQKSMLLFFLEDIKFCIPGTAPDKTSPSGLILAYIAFMLLSATACTLACFLLARRYGFSRARRIGWAVIGFLFGWIGLVMMLAIQEWPARLACPRCRKLRVVTHAHCEHCGALHAKPAPDGTEIFESPITVPETALTPNG
jgi:hypothetical protein